MSDDNTINCNIIKCNKNNETIYILTNLVNKTRKSIKRLYMQRWTVETDFKKQKYDILFNKIRSKTKKQVMIDILILNLNCLIIALIENLCKTDNSKKINSKAL